jgi:peroxin-1
MPSKRKPTPVVSREGISGTKGGSREQEIASVEIDTTFGRVLGLTDGQKVRAVRRGFIRATCC